jgi:hydroxymethylglutaryl-CoA lyase
MAQQLAFRMLPQGWYAMAYDYFQIFPRMPRQVTLADITVRDGLQHEERFISTKAKIYYLEQLVFAGLRHLEVTNLGNSYLMPQFADGQEILTYLRGERFAKKCQKRGINPQDIAWTAITIREKAVDAAIELKKQGIGPDRLLMMVSTEEQHHYINSGTTLPEYWQEAERCIKKAHDAGMTMCGTVSTIWGGPILGKTKLADAYAFTKRWLDIGADSIEHADHDGSASAQGVFQYFSEILDRFPDPKIHIAHWVALTFWPPCRPEFVTLKRPLGELGGCRPTLWMIVPAGLANITLKIPAKWV